MTKTGRVGPRLTVCQQILRDPSYRGRQLAIFARTDKGKMIRAVDIFDLEMQHLSENGTIYRMDMVTPKLVAEAANILLEIRTPQGHLLNLEAVKDLSPETIDNVARQVDELYRRGGQRRYDDLRQLPAGLLDDVKATLQEIYQKRRVFERQHGAIRKGLSRLTQYRINVTEETDKGARLRIDLKFDPTLKPIEPSLVKTLKSAFSNYLIERIDSPKDTLDYDVALEIFAEFEKK